MKFLIITLLTLSTSAFAQKKSMMNFEDELVQGAVNKPDLSIILEHKGRNFSRLIKLRENFLSEMHKTSEVMHTSQK